MFIELISIVIAFIFLLYWSGIGLTRIVIPEKFKDYELLVIPFLGLFAVLFFAHIFSFIGLGSRTFTWIILAIITPLNIYAVKRKGLPSINPSETLPVFVVAAVVFLVGMLPLFYEGYLTVVGTNGDAAHYTALSDHFLANGLAPPEGKGTWYTNIIQWLLTSASSRLGPMYFQSMIGAITGLEGYKTFTVTINLFRSILLFSVYLLIRSEGLFSRKVSLFIIVMLGINSSLYWLAINGYLAQTMMASVLPLALTASFCMMSSKGYNGIAFSAAISSAILMLSPESIILLLGPLFLFTIIKVIGRNLVFRDALQIILPWLLILVVLNVIPLKASFEWLYNLITVGLEKGFQQANPGDVGYFIPLTQVFGLTPPYHPLYREISNHPAYATTAYLAYYYSAYIMAFIGLFLIGYAAFKADTQRRIVFMSILIPYLFMALYFRFTFPYGYFKITSSTLFITIILIAAGIWSAFSSRLPLILKAAISTVAVLIVSLSLISLYILFDMVINDENEEWITINKELLVLRDIQKRIRKDEQILVEERLGRGNKYYWIAYLLQDREVLTRKALPGTESFRDKELSFDYVIDGGYRYQQYIEDGWTPVITTSRYVMLGKDKR